MRPDRYRSFGSRRRAAEVRLTRGPRRRLAQAGEPPTPEEAWIRTTFRAFKAGLSGGKGEASVRAALDGLGVLAVHDVIVPDRRGLTQIDHLVRAPNAVLVLETKRYSGIVSGEVNGREWVQCFEDRAERFVLPNPLRQNFRHCRAVEDLIADRAVLVRGHVVSAGNARFEGELVSATVPLADLAQLIAGAAPVSQRWLDAAWHKLQAAAARSPLLRAAHRGDLESRRH